MDSEEKDKQDEENEERQDAEVDIDIDVDSDIDIGIDVDVGVDVGDDDDGLQVKQYSQDKFKGQKQLSRTRKQNKKNYMRPTSVPRPKAAREEPYFGGKRSPQKIRQRFPQPGKGVELFTQCKQGLGPI